MAGKTTVVTGKGVRFSYANLLEPKSFNGGQPKYGVSLVIPKSDTTTIDKIEAAIKAAYEDGKYKLMGTGSKVPSLASIRNPLRDGDVERPDDEVYQDAFFVNANSNNPPVIVDAKCHPITSPSEVYSGVYGKASVNFYAYNVNGNRGIACGLNGVQVLRKGAPLGASSGANDFSIEDDADSDDEDGEDILN